MSSSHYKPDDALKKRLTTPPAKEGDKIIITIKPKALTVNWGKDSRCWDINEKENETGSITLKQVSWLEATGSFPTEFLTKDGKYSVKFKVSMKADAFGWQGSPVYFFVLDPTSKKNVWKKHDLNTVKKGGKEELVPNDLDFEYKSQESKVSEIKFGLYEIWKGRWKGGLEILEVVIQQT